MKTLRYILFLLILTLTSPITAKQRTHKTELPTEGEQQFTYYFYAAKQALDNEQYQRAFLLLNICAELRPTDAMTQAYLGMIYEALRENKKALLAFEKAYQEDSEEYWRRYVRALYKTNDKKLLKQAIRITEKRTKQSHDVDDLDILRQMYLGNLQYKKAIQTQDRIDIINGYDAYSAVNRYQTYIQWNKPVKAIKAVNDYLEIDPTNLQFLLFRIELYEYLHVDFATLELAYQATLVVDPNNLMVMNNYAYNLAIRNKDLQIAERMSRRTIQQDPDNATYLDTYAWILFLNQQTSLAAFYIQKAKENASEQESEEINYHYNIIMNAIK